MKRIIQVYDNGYTVNYLVLFVNAFYLKNNYVLVKYFYVLNKVLKILQKLTHEK